MPAKRQAHTRAANGHLKNALAAAWTPRRIRLWLTAAFVAAWLPVLGVPVRGFLDFSAFYTAATFAFTPDVVRLEPIVLAQAAAGLPISPYLYTPAFALLYVPLTGLPYAVAGVLNLLLMLGALLAAARLAAPMFGIPRRVALVGAVTWAPAAASILSGQNATLALLLIMLAGAAFTQTNRRMSAAVASICTSVVAYKPQFAAPVVGVGLVRGRVLFVALVFVGLIAHYLLSVVAAGGNWAWPLDWFATLASYSDVDLETNGWSAVSITSLLARIELPPWTDGAPAGLQGLAIVGLLVGGVIALGCLPALRSLPLPRALALACALIVLVMPHAWIYNATLLLPALAVIASDATSRGWPWQDRWLIAAAYGIALLWPLGGVLGVTAMPLVTLLSPFVLLRSSKGR